MFNFKLCFLWLLFLYPCVANQNEDANQTVENYNGNNDEYGVESGGYYDSNGNYDKNNYQSDEYGHVNQSYQGNEGETPYPVQQGQEVYGPENQETPLNKETNPSTNNSITDDDEIDEAKKDQLKKNLENMAKIKTFITFNIIKKSDKSMLESLNIKIDQLPNKQRLNDFEELENLLNESYMKIKTHQEFFDFADIEKRTTYMSNQNNYKLEKNHFLFFVCDYQIFSTNSNGGNFSYLIQFFNKNFFFINNLGILKLNLIGRGSNILFHSLSFFEMWINGIKAFVSSHKFLQNFNILKYKANIFNKEMAINSNSSQIFNKTNDRNPPLPFFNLFQKEKDPFILENNQYKSLVANNSNFNLLGPILDEKEKNMYDYWGIYIKGDFFNNYKLIPKSSIDMINTFNEISLLLQSHSYLHQKFFSVMFNIHYSVIANIENFAGKKKKPLAEISMFFLFINSIKQNTFEPTEEFVYWKPLTYFQGDKIQIQFPLQKMYFFLGFQKNFFIPSKILSSFIHNFFIYYIISPYELKHVLDIFGNTMVGFSWGVKYFNINFVFYNYQINVHTCLQSGLVKAHPHQVQNFFMDGNLPQKNR